VPESADIGAGRAACYCTNYRGGVNGDRSSAIAAHAGGLRGAPPPTRSSRRTSSHRRLPGGLHCWPREAAEVPKALPAVHRAALPGHRQVRMKPRGRAATACPLARGCAPSAARPPHEADGPEGDKVR